MVEDELTRRACRNFYIFFVKAWGAVWPSIKFKNNWHYKYLCDIFETEVHRIAKGEKKTSDIIVNVPPRTLKSTMLSICLNAWTWTLKGPGYRSQKFLTASYADKLSMDLAVYTRTLIESPWYRRLWPEVRLRDDQNTKTNFMNTHGGFRLATSTGASAVGQGGDWIIFDDCMSPQEALSSSSRATCHNWFDNTMQSRLNDQEVGIRVIVEQRLHNEDLTGYVLNKNAADWRQICLDAEDSENVKPAELRRFYVNGLLFPERLSKETLQKMRANVSSYIYDGQYRQAPSAQEGTMFKKVYWKFWCHPGQSLPSVTHTLPDGTIHTAEVLHLPRKFEDEITSWDMTFKKTAGSDRVCGQDWARGKGKLWLLDQNLGQMTFTEATTALVKMSKARRNCSAHLVEDKANGPAVMDTLKTKIPNLVPVTPLGSKIARAVLVDASKAMSLLATAEAGNIVLPHPSIANWVNAFIDEFAKFPMDKHDDQVDAASQACRRLLNFASLPISSGSDDNESDSMVECPNCGEMVHETATICEICDHQLEGIAA